MPGRKTWEFSSWTSAIIITGMSGGLSNFLPLSLASVSSSVLDHCTGCPLSAPIVLRSLWVEVERGQPRRSWALLGLPCLCGPQSFLPAEPSLLGLRGSMWLSCGSGLVGPLARFRLGWAELLQWALLLAWVASINTLENVSIWFWCLLRESQGKESLFPGGWDWAKLGSSCSCSEAATQFGFIETEAASNMGFSVSPWGCLFSCL